MFYKDELNSRKVVLSLPFVNKNKKYAGLLPIAFFMSVNAAVADDPEKDQGIETILVTAQKRVENLQEIAVSVDAVSGVVIKDHALDSFKDITKLLPGITMAVRNDPRSLGFMIRGIGSQQTHIGVEPSSAVIVDGEVMARNSSLHGDMGDIDQVIVLKGPQGTLFGKNTVAGALVVNNTSPVIGSSEGNVNLHRAFAKGTDGEYKISAMYNAEVSNNSALRFNIYKKDQDGWIENVLAGGPNGGESDGFGAKVQYLYQPSDDLDMLFRVEYAEANFGPGIRVYRKLDRPIIPEEDLATLTPEQREAALTTRIHEISQTPEGEWNDKTSAWNNRDYGGMTNVGASFELNYTTASDYQLTYQAFTRSHEMTTNESVASTAVNTAALAWSGPVETDTYQTELRIASPTGGFIDYVAGLFYYHADITRERKTLFCNDRGLENSTIDENYNITECGDTNAWDASSEAVLYPFDFYTASDGTSNPWIGGITNKHLKNNTIISDNAAIFGQANLNFSDKFKGVIGARYLYENQDYSIDTRIHESDVNSEFQTSTKEVSDTALVYKLALQYFINEDVMAYTSYTTGYKGVAWNSENDLNQEKVDADYPLPAETSTNIELGIRSDWFESTLRVNATLFWADFDHYQDRVRYVDDSDPSELPLLDYKLIDAGELNSRGLDLEIQYELTDSLSIQANYNYLDATFGDSEAMIHCTDEVADQCTESQVFRRWFDPSLTSTYALYSLKGKQLANAPQNQFKLNLVYDFEVADWNGYARVSYNWKDDVSPEHGGIESHPDLTTEAYAITDVNVTLFTPIEGLSVNLYVKNLFDEHYYVRKSNYGDGQQDLAIGTYFLAVPELPGGTAYGLGYWRSAPEAGNVARDFNRYFGMSVNYDF